MFNIAPNFINSASQRILSQSSNISYTARGVYRVKSVPDNRKAEYLFRDFYMTLVCAYLTELAFRATDTMYSIPLMTKALDLHRLSELYGPGVENYKNLPEPVRKRILGTLNKDGSIPTVPRLIEEMELGKPNLTPQERQQMEVLVKHLYKKMNFQDYVKQKLVQAGELSSADADDVIRNMQKLMPLTGDGKQKMLGKIGDILKQPAEKHPELVQEAVASWRQMFAPATEAEKTLLEKVSKDIEDLVKLEAGRRDTFITRRIQKLRGILGLEGPLRKSVKAQLNQLFALSAENQAAHLAHLEETALKAHPLKGKILDLVKEGLESHKALNHLKKIKKSGSWPMMAASVGLTFVFYGLVANIFDVKLLQPWQKKLVAERGTAQDVVAPAYWAMIPGAMALTYGMWNRIAPKFIQRMGYLQRFAVVGLAALATYTGSMLGLVKYKLGKKPVKPENNSVAQPPATAPASRQPVLTPRMVPSRMYPGVPVNRPGYNTPQMPFYPAAQPMNPGPAVQPPQQRYY